MLELYRCTHDPAAYSAAVALSLKPRTDTSPAVLHREYLRVRVGAEMKREPSVKENDMQ